MHTRSHEATHCEEAREAMSDTSRDRRQESGFALILAILALMLLTFLGLTLATTTSTELRIATNYRWNTQALYNAEAGIEAGKRLLQTLNWSAILPQADRGIWTPPTSVPFTPSLPSNPIVGVAGSTRNYEMGDCDTLGNGVGYGVVLNDGTNVYENVSIVPGLAAPPALNGAFTLWIRRPVQRAATAGQYQDDTAQDTMILTAEGIAPYSGGALGNALARGNLARRIIEASVRRQAQPGSCDTRGGQIGGGPEGNNVFGGGCVGTDISDAVANAGFKTGSGARITP
jgi:PilX N-terminal